MDWTWIRRFPWKWIGRSPDDIVLNRFRVCKLRKWLSIEVHEFVGSDWPGCFHTHPSWHLRIILSGQYLDENRDGRMTLWAPGVVGLVGPKCAHRIALLSRRCITLWISGPSIAPIWLLGEGWRALGLEPGSRSHVA